MSCPHTTTTTLLWLYGEGPEDHGLHVASCPACQAVVAEHADVWEALGSSRSAPRPSIEGAAPPPAPAVARPALWVAAVALAAGVALALRPSAPAPAPAPASGLDPVVLDARLDDLEWRLADLHLDLQPL